MIHGVLNNLSREMKFLKTIKLGRFLLYEEILFHRTDFL